MTRRPLKDRVAEYVDSPRLDQRLKRGTGISARVHGTLGLYRVHADLKDPKDWGCTCPSQYQPCKHVEALVATYQNQPKTFVDLDQQLWRLRKRSVPELVKLVGTILAEHPNALESLGVRESPRKSRGTDAEFEGEEDPHEGGPNHTVEKGVGEPRPKPRRNRPVRSDEEAAAGRHGDEEREFRGFVVAIERHVSFPFPAEALGEEVSVLGVDHDRSTLRAGMFVRVVKAGRPYPASLATLVLPRPLPGAEHIEAYLAWANLAPAGAAMRDAPRPRFTPRQGQYLSYIAQYARVHGRPPAENEIARYFGVTGPSAHGMVVSMARKGLIERTPGAPRSIRLLVAANELPELHGPVRAREG